MKQQSIQSLLEKYREGTLTESELAELEMLTHKAEVMAAASRRATGIIVRRRISMAMAVLLVGGAGVWAVLPHGGQETMMAESRPPVEVQLPPEVLEEVQQPAVTLTEQPPATVAAPVKQRPAKAVAEATPKREIPVVVCNNQCDADSVINDIKKFLSV